MNLKNQNNEKLINQMEREMKEKQYKHISSGYERKQFVLQCKTQKKIFAQKPGNLILDKRNILISF